MTARLSHPVDASIVVPTYNSASTLRLLLDIVTAETSALWSHEVIVVDDASTDATPKLVGDYRGVRYLRQPANAGPARARNRGARDAQGAYVIFIDSDIVPQLGFLDRFMQAMTEGEDVAGVSGIYAEEPLFNDGYVCDFRNLQTHFWKVSSPGVAHGNFPVSLCILRRANFLSVGGLAESFGGADVEDFEFGQRMGGRDRSLIISTRIQGHHHPEETLRKLLRVLFRRSRQYASTVAVSLRSPSHYATPRRSVTLVGTVLTLVGLVAGLWHWIGWLGALSAYLGLVLYPDADYYRFLYRKRRGVLFAYYCWLQFLCNLAMTGGLAAGAVEGLLSPLRALIRRMT